MLELVLFLYRWLAQMPRKKKFRLEKYIYLQTVGVQHLISSFLWNNLNPTWMLILLRLEEIRWCMSQATAVTTMATAIATSTIRTTSVVWSCWLMNSFWERVEKVDDIVAASLGFAYLIFENGAKYSCDQKFRYTYRDNSNSSIHDPNNFHVLL